MAPGRRKGLILVCVVVVATPVTPFLLTSALIPVGRRGAGECTFYIRRGSTAGGTSANGLTTTTSSSCCSSDEGHEQLLEPTSATSEQNTPSQLRQASLERWLQLPESWASAKKTNATQPQLAPPSKISKDSYQKHIQSLHADNPIRLGQTRKKRSAELIHAAEVGNATRLELLLEAGADVDAMDLYRISSLHYAACHGHLDAVKMLLKWGATNDNNPMLEEDDDCSMMAKAGSSPLRAAFANGHTEIFELLHNHSCGNKNGLPTVLPTSSMEPPTAIQFNDTSVQQMAKTTVIPSSSDHIGAGSFYIDNAVCGDCIDALAAVHKSLRENNDPKRHDSQRTMQSTNSARRSHYCDTEGWLVSALNTALEQTTTQQTQTQQQPPQSVFSHVRFISYLGENATTSYLAPHKDFPVLDRSSGLSSTHTFILYLTTVQEGGETVLLDHLPAKNNNALILDDGMTMQYAVQPVRGRLFVFPHGCPHAGRQVVEGSKLILRGDAW